MVMTFARASHPDPGETPEQRDERIKREAALIAASHAAIDAGRGIDLDNLLDQFDGLDVGTETDRSPLDASGLDRPRR